MFFSQANENGDIGYSTLIVFVKNSKFCKALERLEGGDKTKMELILTRINRVHSGRENTKSFKKTTFE
jgi:hypothetical protein